MGKTNVYEMVTDRIIAELEKGKIPWRKPWINVLEDMDGAFNRVTKKSYSILNQMLLKHEGEYASYNQWKKLGGNVKKGERAEMVVFWKMIEVEEENEDGEKKIKHVPLLRYYNVFHISQIEGVKPLEIPKKDEKKNTIERADELITSYVEREEIDFREEASNEAYYISDYDRVVVPKRTQYKNGNEFYSTAFHELVHSTEHETRLDRIKDKAAFGNEEYSKEELVAEIGAASILNMIGIETPKTFKNSAAYIQSWIKVLKNDFKFIVSAASRADKAVRFIVENNNDKPKKGKSTTEKAEKQNTEQKSESVVENSTTLSRKTRRQSESTIIKRIIKNAEEQNMNGESSEFQFEGKTYYGITDGKRVCASQDLYAYGENKKPLDMESMFEILEDGNHLDLYPVMLNRDAIAEKKKINKKEKSKKPFIIEIQLDPQTIGYVGIKPEYALDVMDFCRTDYMFIHIDEEYWNEDNLYKLPIYFIGENKEKIGIVLPVVLNNSMEVVHFKSDQKGKWN